MTITLDARWRDDIHFSYTQHYARLYQLEFPVFAGGAQRSPAFFNWTTSTRRIAYGGTFWTPIHTPDASQIRKGGHVSPSTMELSGPWADDEDDGITLDDLIGGRIHGAKLTHTRIDTRRPWVTSPLSDVFYVDNPVFAPEGWRLPFVSARGRLNANRGRVRHRTCQRELGDGIGEGGCGVPLDGSTPYERNRISGARGVSMTTKDRANIRLQFTADTTTADTYWTQQDWFAFGTLVGSTTIVENPNFNFSRKIATSQPANKVVPGSPNSTYQMDITLLEPMPFDVDSLSFFDCVVGCDKLPTTCRDKFPIEADIGNLRRFLGDPYLAGADSQIEAPDAQ